MFVNTGVDVIFMRAGVSWVVVTLVVIRKVGKPTCWNKFEQLTKSVKRVSDLIEVVGNLRSSQLVELWLKSPVSMRPV